MESTAQEPLGQEDYLVKAKNDTNPHDSPRPRTLQADPEALGKKLENYRLLKNNYLKNQEQKVIAIEKNHLRLI